MYLHTGHSSFPTPAACSSLKLHAGWRNWQNAHTHPGNALCHRRLTKEDAIELAQLALRHHVLPAAKEDGDVGLLPPARGQHVRVHVRMRLDDGVVRGAVRLQRRVHDAQAKAHVEHPGTRLGADGLCVLEHERPLPSHHHRLTCIARQQAGNTCQQQGKAAFQACKKWACMHTRKYKCA